MFHCFEDEVKTTKKKKAKKVIWTDSILDGEGDVQQNQRGVDPLNWTLCEALDSVLGQERNNIRKPVAELRPVFENKTQLGIFWWSTGNKTMGKIFHWHKQIHSRLAALYKGYKEFMLQAKGDER